MEINNQIITDPARDSATVIMLRDSPLGTEVFLVRRHGASAVLGGVFVFPGGKLDPSDAQLDAAKHLDVDAGALHAALAEPELPLATAQGLYVAAMREAFEESGVLFAVDVTPAQSQQAAQLIKEGGSFNQVLLSMQLRLHTRSVLPWSRWITPLMPSVSSKRFDTRFFVATVPAEQTALHDNIETTESVWLRPREALEKYWNGEIDLAPPQIMTLAHLSRHASVASVQAHARAYAPPVILPSAFNKDGERIICYPGDTAHSVGLRAMPGPTRLVFRNRRFEPEEGFEAWFR